MRKLGLLLAVLLLSLSTLSCRGQQRRERSYWDSNPPEQATIYLETMYFNPGTGEEIARGSGSGVCVDRFDGGCYVLTAAHVCQYDLLEAIRFPVPEGNLLPPIHMMTGRTVNGSYYNDITVIDRDSYSDLCLLDVRGDFSSEVNQIATLPYLMDDEPEQSGMLMTALGFPLGMFGTGSSWSLSAIALRWAGYMPEFITGGRIQEGDYMMFSGSEVMPGNSGGPILYNGALVSLVCLDIGGEQLGWEYAAGPSPTLVNAFIRRNQLDVEFLD